MSFKSVLETHRTYPDLFYEYEVHVLSNTKVSVAKDCGKNCMEVRPSLVRHLLRNGPYSSVLIKQLKHRKACIVQLQSMV